MIVCIFLTRPVFKPNQIFWIFYSFKLSMFIMKEDDPTVLENQSSPVRGDRTSNTDQDIMPSGGGGRGGAWTPLKDETSVLSPRSTAGPSSPADSDLDGGGMISPMQHLMTEESQMNGNNSNSKIRKSDDDYYDVDLNDNDQRKTPTQRRNMVVYSLCCLVLAVIVAAIITTVVLLLMKNSPKKSSSEASSSTNDPPMSVVVVVTPAPVPIPNNNSTNSSHVPSSMPSLFRNNNNDTAASDVPTIVNINSTTTPSISPLFVRSPTVSNTTNSTPITSSLSPTIMSRNISLPPTLIPTAAPMNNTTTSTLAPVAAISEENAAKVMPILQTFLLPNDYTIISTMDTTSILTQSYQYMISSDTFLASDLVIYSELQVFQRYILIVLHSVLQPSPLATTTQNTIRINLAADHCIWIGITCNTNTTDMIPDGIVTDLVWSEYRLLGTIPTTIQYLSSLTKLDLGSNELSGMIPNELYTNLTNLQHLYLHDNQLTGTLSNTGLSQLPNLIHLFLNDNRLTGTLPQNLGSPGTNAASARPLEWLNLYNNSFTGSIPLNWNLRKVFLLDLGRNQLTGSIPADWVDDMFALKILYLNHNQLSGSFPTNFTLIGNNRLWLIQVNNNQLTGVIPGGYNVRQLDLAEYQNNLFTSMDTEMCRNIVFIGGEMVSMRSDCGATCPCTYYCGANECY